MDYLFKPLDAEVLRSKVAVFVDLARKTDLLQKRTEELIEREQEMRALAETKTRLFSDLEQKHRDLEAANEDLEAFSYSVFHDLRGPLRSIDGFSRVLLKDCGDLLGGKGRQHLQYILESTQQMGQLIDCLLSLSRATRGELRRETVNLTAVAEGVVDRLRRAAPERIVEFVNHEKILASGDAHMLEAVLDNLLSNAWKFTAKRKDARIELATALEGGEPVYVVRDNGAGFDMSNAGKLFGAFQRLHEAAEFEGHGIGLTTVQRIVQRHGGRVWAEGVVDRGATFRFTLGEKVGLQ